MPSKHRKHTPITSEAQRGLFGAELGRARRGEARKTKLTMAEMSRHLKEAKGKKLPKRKNTSEDKFAKFIKGRRG